jgi:hypothetical protein
LKPRRPMKAACWPVSKATGPRPATRTAAAGSPARSWTGSCASCLCTPDHRCRNLKEIINNNNEHAYAGTNDCYTKNYNIIITIPIFLNLLWRMSGKSKSRIFSNFRYPILHQNSILVWPILKDWIRYQVCITLPQLWTRDVVSQICAQNKRCCQSVSRAVSQSSHPGQNTNESISFSFTFYFSQSVSQPASQAVKQISDPLFHETLNHSSDPLTLSIHASVYNWSRIVPIVYKARKLSIYALSRPFCTRRTQALNDALLSRNHQEQTSSK